MQVLDVLRTEKKYPVCYEAARKLARRLKYVLQLDPHTENPDGYIVRSVYFDSFSDRDYFEKSDGLECRKKIRLRTYGTGGIVKLEWKQKQNHMQRKRSLILSLDEAQNLLRGEYACLRRRPEPLAQEFYGLMTTQTYRPRCLVQYNRLAWIEPTNDTRITLDSDLRANEGYFDLFSSHPPLYPAARAGEVTLEVKYSRFLLSYIKNAISSCAGPQASVGKYYSARIFGPGGRM